MDILKIFKKGNLTITWDWKNEYKELMDILYENGIKYWTTGDGITDWGYFEAGYCSYCPKDKISLNKFDNTISARDFIKKYSDYNKKTELFTMKDFKDNYLVIFRNSKTALVTSLMDGMVFLLKEPVILPPKEEEPSEPINPDTPLEIVGPTDPDIEIEGDVESLFTIKNRIVIESEDDDDIIIEGDDLGDVEEDKDPIDPDMLVDSLDVRYYFTFDEYNWDFTNKEDEQWDIVKIYGPTSAPDRAFWFLSEDRELLWEEKKTLLTVEEISKLLGYQVEIKIEPSIDDEENNAQEDGNYIPPNEDDTNFIPVEPELPDIEIEGGEGENANN